jgi:MspA protein
VLVRPLAVLTALVLTFSFTSPTATADPETEPVSADSPAPADDGRVESSPPATTRAPDGWTQTVSAKDEIQRVIAPLTTAVSSREYQVGGTYSGSLSGPEGAGPPEGTLEVGIRSAVAST